MPLAAGTRFGPYEILSQLGAGGMGEVYRALDPRLGREVAIKVLPASLAQDAEALGRFQREARAVAALTHPNVVVLYDCGTDQGVSFVVMELLAGESLRSRMARGPLAWPQAVQLGINLADGLAAAHAKGIIHRDLKPENIFLTPEGHAKILDFGLARLDGGPAQNRPHVPPATLNPPGDTRFDLDPADSATVDSRSLAETYVPPHPAQSTLMGTVGYMSPEHVRGEVVDARTDLFALGCVLYEALTGCRAFSRTTPAETITAVLTDEPPDVTSLSDDAPVEVESLVRKCLAKEAAKRYQSAREVAATLRQVVAGPQPNWFRRYLIWGLAAAFTVALALGLHALRRGSIPEGIDSIAVVPFSFAPEDERAAYLSDAITDSLIRSLSQAPELRVMSRTAVDRFREHLPDAVALGERLGVRCVLSGRISLRESRLTIDVELIDITDGRQLWSERYQRRVEDVQAVQSDLAAQIAEKLHIRLGVEQQQKIAQPTTRNSEAYEQYVKGRYFWNKRTREGVQRAIGCFLEAAQKDAHFAQAHAGLADSYNILGSYGYVSPQDAFPKAKEAALQALRLDGTLAEAHAALAQVYELWDRDFQAAEESYLRALSLNANYATAHQWYAFCLAETGRIAEAKAAVQQAKELEPLSLSINSAQGWILYLAREYELAADQLAQTLEMEPRFAPAHATLGLVRAQQGRFAEALTAIQKARELAPGDVEFLANQGAVAARAGRRDEARRVLGELEVLRNEKKYVSSYYFAAIHAGLGEHDQAFAWLNDAFLENACALVSLPLDSQFDTLRADRRFAELLHRLQLPR
jgi:serine/threonine protein kinase/tetratricopeptide (TPR) repeat protein